MLYVLKDEIGNFACQEPYDSKMQIKSDLRERFKSIYIGDKPIEQLSLQDWLDYTGYHVEEVLDSTC